MPIDDRELREFVAEATGAPSAVHIVKLGRRHFLKLTGISATGLVLGVGMHAPKARATGTATFVPNAWLYIDGDSIVIRATNPEVGQGVKTSLPMIVAEELDARWADVRVEQSAIDEATFGRQVAGGSRSVPTQWDALRRAGAAARAMLVAAAAERWGVATNKLSTRDSHVVHPNGEQLSYFDLARDAARQPLPDVDALVLKLPRDYRLLGTWVPGVDNHAIVTGRALFGIDHRLPDTLFATYVKCPATGGKVARANLDQVKKLAGVVDAFVLDGNGKATELMPGVAIVARDTWAVLAARRALEVVWDESTAAKDSVTAAAARAQKLLDADGEEVISRAGDVELALGAASRTVDARYEYAFVAHAQLEPQSCSAHFHDGRIELWAPTQTPARGIQNVASTLGIAEHAVTVHQLRGGGGFGRRLVNEWMCEAAAIAARVKGPIKLQWTREDDMQHDFYRAGGFHALKAGLDPTGRLTAWRQRFVTFTTDGMNAVSGGQLGKTVFPGELPAAHHMSQTKLAWHTPCGAWRAPGSNAFAFVVQSFIHELAVAAGRDHVEFLLEQLGAPRWLEPGNAWALNTERAARVIKFAADRAGWGRKMPAGRGLGLAFYFSHAGHVAEVADVSVDANRKIVVHRVTVAADVGQIVNDSGARNQCEGAVVDGLSAMLAQQITFEAGRAQQSNFDQYPLLRMRHAPAVDVHFLQSDYAPTGLGEPALPPLAPAVCNAIFAACGERIRALPILRAGFTV